MLADHSSTVRYVLFPGRHHVLTRYQETYLKALLAGQERDVDGEPITMASDATVVWAVTSANHHRTRRNPIPFDRREAAIERLSATIGLPSLIVAVFDAQPSDRFAQTTVATVAAEIGVQLTPANTVVACSTPAVMKMYATLGYRIAPVEHGSVDEIARPWDVLEMLAAGDGRWTELAHPATVDVFTRYRLDELVARVCNDPVVGDEGGLTDTRQYRTYITAFEDAAARKWAQAAPYVQPGRIVDIGCATGAMLELAAAEPRLHESDLFGVEVARHLFDECQHKKSQGAFAANPNTFFVQRNMLAGPAFEPRSVDTTLTFALTHEIFSYGGGVDALTRLIANIYDHTAPGGVWINSDVCGPDNPDQLVRVRLTTDDGVNPDHPTDLRQLTSTQAKSYLDGLSTRSRLDQFAVDFTANANPAFTVTDLGYGVVQMRLGDAMEFLSKKDYTDSWLSESHERFCFFDFAAWKTAVEAAGFELDPGSHGWCNDWLVTNRFAGKAELCDMNGRPVAWPTTHLLLIARRPVTP